MAANQDHQEERRLVRAALAGDDQAVNELLERLNCVPRVLAVLNRRVGNPLAQEDLRDLTQEVLTTFWGRLGDYSGRAALETWAYGFCLNTYMAFLRRRGKRLCETLEESRTAEPSEERPPLEDVERLQAGLARLEEQEQRVIRLKYFDDLTFEEIGARTGISVNTLKTRFYRGMRRLELFVRGAREEGGA